MVGVSSAEISGLYLRYTAERRRGDCKETMKRKMCHFVFFFSICGTTNWLEVSGNFAVTVLRYTP
jgi:hypothetical protein